MKYLRSITCKIPALLGCLLLLACGEKSKTTPNMKLNWNKLSTNGLQGDLAKGVSASYAALIHGKLIVAGGANFPGKLGFEGGSKAFYSDILLYDTQTEQWQPIGQLPDSSAYGVSVPVSDGALWIGGNTATQSLKSVYRIAMPETGSVELKPFPELPAALDNFAGCPLGDTVFIGGGNVDGKPANTFYCINTKADSGWTALPDFPGLPRVQPVMAAVEHNGKRFVYLLGGFFGGDAQNKPAMATEVLRYDTETRVWETAGKQIDEETGALFSLAGATAMPVDNRYILCFGGVNHAVFLDAVTTQYNIGNDTTISAEEKSRLNLEFSKNYMTQPIEYYKFNPECRIFDTFTGEWRTIEVTPYAAHAGATLAFSGKTFYAVQGELKPGVRTPVTVKGEIKYEK